MNIPSELYTVVRRAQFAHEPVLIHAFYGFVDAGGGARLAVEHILATCEHHTLATFDVDQVMVMFIAAFFVTGAAISNQRTLTKSSSTR